MKQKISLALILGCALALCLSFTGCNNSVSNEKFLGTWELIEVYSDTSISTEEFAKLKEHDCIYTLELYEDGTYTCSLFGHGTWKAKTEDEGTIRIKNSHGDETDQLYLGRGDYLTLDDTFGHWMTFKRTSDTPDSSQDDSLSTSNVVVDDSTCTIKIQEPYSSENNIGYQVKITNHSNVSIYVTAERNTFSVDNVMAEPTIGITVEPGETEYDKMFWSYRELPLQEKTKIDDLKHIEGNVEVRDDETYDILASYPIYIE